MCIVCFKGVNIHSSSEMLGDVALMVCSVASRAWGRRGGGGAVRLKTISLCYTHENTYT